MPLPAEFDLIARHFRPLAGEGALNLTDDAAILTLPPGRELVITTDTMVAGVHYLPESPAFGIARKLLRVNLSDIAAMGATPFAYLLAVSMPRGTPGSWLADFAAGLAADQAAYKIHLLGGDTTSTPGPTTLTVTMLGHAAPGAAWRRSGARPGDDIWVTGTIGRGVLGLHALRGEIPDPAGALAAHYLLPSPRVGLRLHGLVTAAMDLSDGLLQDAAHIARASGLSLAFDLARIPLCPEATQELLISGAAGGDDYELLLTAAPEDAARLQAAADGVSLTRIGTCLAGPPHVIARGADGATVPTGRGGWSHF
jgi:thiamine-monophosphate kinase